MIVCGIDPGMAGALAFYDNGLGSLTVHDCPVLTVGGKSVMDLPQLITLLAAYKASACVIERAQSMPGQGVSSVFSYGQGYGSYLGILAALQIPHTRISPVEWKKKLRVPSDKDGARARASELMPAHAGLWPLKKHHGRAEAALIAYYGAHGAQL